MDSNYKTIPIFPVPIHQFDIGGFDQIKNKLIDYAYDIQKQDSVGKTVSNRGGWQSKNFNIRNKDDILQGTLMNCLAGFPTIKESYGLSGEVWININKTGNYNAKHHHPNSNLSGVLWIKIPENSGRIEFISPVDFQADREVRSYTEEFKDKHRIHHSYYFPPIEGRMLVFPSHLIHHVTENKSDEDRISVSFNLIIQ
tara:strand:- start:200 stop:793 length:594 start_codon:yes stop_codon:yes gene_type:complete